MSTATQLILTPEEYDNAAQQYCRSLPLEHFMEATAQATQRKITLESLDVLHARRPEVQIFNELLVQYTVPGRDKLGQVVPDNMIVVHPEPIDAKGSYNIPLHPAEPLYVLEYVSKSSGRKDYDENMQKYEQELRVRYYLLFDPDNQDLRLFRHNGRKFIRVKPNGNNRREISELELEVAIQDGWVRYWYQGKLLPVTAELLADLDTERAARLEADRLRQQENRLRLEADRLRQQENRLRLGAEAQVAQLLAEIAKLKAGTDKNP